MGYIAPKIKFDGDKFNKHTPGEKGYEFAQIPNRLLSYVMREISGTCGNRLKLMIFLMGCGENFEVHEKTILHRTGMSQSAYSQARDWLDENHYITYKKGCNDASIKVNYDYLWSEIEAEEFDEMLEKEEGQKQDKEQDKQRTEVVIGRQLWTWDKFNYLNRVESDYFETQKLDANYIKSQLKKYLSAPAEK